MHTATTAQIRPLFAAAMSFALVLGSCSTPNPERPTTTGLTAHERALAERDFTLPPEDSNLEREGLGDGAMGAFLADIDQRARAWNNLKLTARTSADRQKLSALEREVVELARKRVDDLIVELQQGPVRNRSIAAMGLGFSKDPRALGPLLAALVDPEDAVVENALVALGFQASKDTALAPLAALLESSSNERVRVNAAYALQRTIAAGARDPEVLPALRGALADPEGGVRASAALSLSVHGDAESVDAFGDMLFDEVNFAALAAASALARLGNEAPATRSKAARYLADAYGKSSGARRLTLQRELIVLSGMNLGEDPKAWLDWALRVQ